jgi:hypothetical protein
MTLFFEKVCNPSAIDSCELTMLFFISLKEETLHQSAEAPEIFFKECGMKCRYQIKVDSIVNFFGLLLVLLLRKV